MEYHDLPSEEVPTLSEVQAAVGVLKNYKAAGVCGISPEMVKYSGHDGLKMLHMLISNVWHTGVVPEDWRRALIVPLLKKGDPTNMTTIEASAFSVYLERSLQLCSNTKSKTGLKVCYWKGNVAFARADLAMMPFSALMA